MASNLISQHSGGTRQDPNPRRGTQNIIILTSGLTGSSVLTALLRRAGYWAGDDTFKKEYDTHENVDLIKLNKEILHEANYSGLYEREFRQDVVNRIASLSVSDNGSPYREFLSDCERHEPWIWKDPRLWLTIRYWNKLLDWNQCKVIVLTRHPKNAWVSTILRRQIRSFASMKRYELSIECSIGYFLDANGIDRLRLTFEDLITRPEATIDRLNCYLGSRLSVEDLKAVYNAPLYQTPRGSLRDLLLAILIYAKNYSERWD